MQVLCDLQVLFLIFNCQTPVPDKSEDEPDEPQDTEEPEISGETDNVQSGGTETGDVHQVECMLVLLVVSGAVAVIVWKKRFRI